MSSWSDVVACASDDAAATLLEHGVAVIPNAVDDATVDACRTRAIEDLAACGAAVGMARGIYAHVPRSPPAQLASMPAPPNSRSTNVVPIGAVTVSAPY